MTSVKSTIKKILLAALLVAVIFVIINLVKKAQLNSQYQDLVENSEEIMSRRVDPYPYNVKSSTGFIIEDYRDINATALVVNGVAKDILPFATYNSCNYLRDGEAEALVVFEGDYDYSIEKPQLVMSIAEAWFVDAKSEKFSSIKDRDEIDCFFMEELNS